MNSSTHTIQSLLDFAKQSLAPLYSAPEVRALCHALFQNIMDISPAALYISLEKNVEKSLTEQMLNAVVELKKMRPIQQILGKTEFYGLPFLVNEHTLTPRPETEELVDWMISELRMTNDKLRILDIGTGSGCIAISLAKNIAQSKVTAWDISADALDVARKNMLSNNVHVELEQVDILNSQLSTFSFQFDVIVSNPPYVCNSEKTSMSDNVLRYEPHTALFVEDSEPLIFYEAIADFAKKTLTKNGSLYFEINAMFGREVVEMLEGKGFSNVILKKDINGKDRMIKAIF